MKALGTAAVLYLVVLAPAYAFTEKEMVDRYCVGMIREFTNPDLTRTDCISSTHAIELDFSHRWADGIGQALHYALWTKQFEESPEAFPRWHYQVGTARKAGLILVCRGDKRTETCADHVVRPYRIAQEFSIPLTIWHCDPVTDLTLDDCQRLETSDP